MSKMRAGASDPTTKTRKRRRVPAEIIARWHSMQTEIERIRRYIDTITSSFKREFESHDAYLAKWLALATHPDSIQAVAEDRAEAERFYVDLFPAFALEPTFVATYSLLEDQMFEIAGAVGERLGIKPDPRDVSGRHY